MLWNVKHILLLLSVPAQGCGVYPKLPKNKIKVSVFIQVLWSLCSSQELPISSSWEKHKPESTWIKAETLILFLGSFWYTPQPCVGTERSNRICWTFQSTSDSFFSVCSVRNFLIDILDELGKLAFLDFWEFQELSNQYHGWLEPISYFETF